MTDWKTWHAAYDDPSSSLARRLAVVRQHVSQALARPREAMPISVLSLCSGDGRDLLPVLAGSDLPTARVVLVEQDRTLAEASRRTAAQLRLDDVTVITADAGDTANYVRALPADLLLLCGIFGNVSEPDIQKIVAATPTMLRDNGRVIWTRGSTTPDLRPTIRQWFQDAGLSELAFDSESEGFGVGVAIKPANADGPPSLPPRLFEFVR